MAVQKVQRSKYINLYVARGGALRGDADYEVVFETRPQALAFLANQHGLSREESLALAKESKLKLKRNWHGSDACAVKEVKVLLEEARKFLLG